MLSMFMYYQYNLLELGNAIYVRPKCRSQVSDIIRAMIMYDVMF